MSHTLCILYLVQFLLLYVLACENSHLSSLLTNRDISLGGKSAVSDRNTILIMESMLNIINAVVKGVPGINLFNFMFLLVNHGKLFFKTQIVLVKKIYSIKIDCFVVDLLHLHLTFVTVCLLYSVHKQ